MWKKFNNVTLIAFISFWFLYLLTHVLDFMLVFSTLLCVYEFLIGGAVLLFHYIFGMIRSSLPYIFIFIGLLVFNKVLYKGYFHINLNELDIKLKKYKTKTPYLIFYFKEYNYFILLLLNILIFVIIFYSELYYNMLILGVFVCFYIFLGLNIILKYFFKKYQYADKQLLNWCINIILAFVISLYLSTVGEAINQVIQLKIDLSNFWYNVVQGNDYFYKKLKIDHEKHLHRFIFTFKNESASSFYIFLKNSGFNNKVLNNLVNTNGKYLSESTTLDKIIIDKNVTDLLVVKDNINNINNINILNNIYIDNSTVWYENQIEAQDKNIKELDYWKRGNHKIWRSHLLNVYSTNATHYSNSNNTSNEVISIVDLLKKDAKVLSPHFRCKNLLWLTWSETPSKIQKKQSFMKYWFYLGTNKPANVLRQTSYFKHNGWLNHKRIYYMEYINKKSVKSHLFTRKHFTDILHDVNVNEKNIFWNWYQVVNLYFVNKCYKNIAYTIIQNNTYEYGAKYTEKYIDIFFDMKSAYSNNMLNLKYHNLYILKHFINDLKVKMKLFMFVWLNQENNKEQEIITHFLYMNYTKFLSFWEHSFYIMNNMYFSNFYDFNNKYEIFLQNKKPLKIELNLSTLLDRNSLYLHWYKKVYSYARFRGFDWYNNFIFLIGEQDKKWFLLFFQEQKTNQSKWLKKWPSLHYFGFEPAIYDNLKMVLEDSLMTFFFFNKNEVIVNYNNTLYSLDWRLYWINYIRGSIYNELLCKVFTINWKEYINVYKKSEKHFMKWFYKFYKNDNKINNLNNKADLYIKTTQNSNFNKNINFKFHDVRDLDNKLMLWFYNYFYKNSYNLNKKIEFDYTSKLSKYEKFRFNELNKILNEDVYQIKLNKLIKYIKEIGTNMYPENISFKHYILTEGISELLAIQVIYSKLEYCEFMQLFKDLNQELLLAENAQSWFSHTITCLKNNLLNPLNNVFEKSNRFFDALKLKYDKQSKIDKQDFDRRADYAALCNEIEYNKNMITGIAQATKDIMCYQLLYDTDDFDIIKAEYKYKLLVQLEKDNNIFIQNYIIDELTKLKLEYEDVLGRISKRLIVHRRKLTFYQNKATNKLTKFVAYKRKIIADPVLEKLKLRKGTKQELALYNYVTSQKFVPKRIASSIVKQNNICLTIIQLDYHKSLRQLFLSYNRRLTELLAELNAIKEIDKNNLESQLKNDIELFKIKQVGKVKKKWEILLKKEALVYKQQEKENEYLNKLQNALINSDWEAYQFDCRKRETQDFNLMRQFKKNCNKK